MIAKKDYYKTKKEGKTLSTKTIEIIKAKLASKEYIDFAINGISESLAEAMVDEGVCKRKDPVEYHGKLNKTKREKIRDYVDRIRCLSSTKSVFRPSEKKQLEKAINWNYQNRHK